VNYLANAAQILIEFIFGILIFLIVLRVLLQAVRANFYNPICQLIYKITNPVWLPLRRVIPAWRSIDIAGIVLAYGLELIKILMKTLFGGVKLKVAGLLILGIAELFDFLLMLILWMIIIRTLIGLIGADRSHPVTPLLYQLTEPLLKPIRYRLPVFSGFDFSPAVAILAIYLARIMMGQPLFDLAIYMGKIH